MNSDSMTIEDSNDYVKEQFYLLLETLDLQRSGYRVSYCRGELNEKLENVTVSNRQIKHLLIEHYGEENLFYQCEGQKKIANVFSTAICPADIVESLRRNDTTDQIKSCTVKLHDECKSFEFNFDSSCDAKGLRIATNSFNENRREIWTMFFKNLFQQTHMSSSLKRKCDVIFQIIYYIIHNGRKKLPSILALLKAYMMNVDQ